MLQLLTILLLIVAVILLLATYFQDSEVGLTDSAAFSSVSNVRSVNKFLERLTIVCFVALIALCIAINVLYIKQTKTSAVDALLKNNPTSQSAPTTVPVGK